MPPAPQKQLRWGRVIFALLFLASLVVGAVYLITGL